jgi:hypothetical protein
VKRDESHARRDAAARLPSLTLGQHTAEVLAEPGSADEIIAAWQDDGRSDSAGLDGRNSSSLFALPLRWVLVRGSYPSL